MIKYFTTDNANKYKTYNLPQALFTNPMYSKVCSDAKILYALLLERNSLSIKNNWVDELGRVFIYFSREEAMEMLGCKNETIAKCFKQLASVDLIEDVRRGLGKANVIYVGEFETLPTQSKENQQTSEKPISGHRKNRLQDIGKTDGSITYYNNTYSSNNNNSKKTSKTKDVVVDAPVKMLVAGFKEKYKADLDPKRAESLIKSKGIDHVEQCLATYGDYLQGRTVKNLGGDFYTFAKDGYTKPIGQVGAIPQHQNFKQREYVEDEFEKVYANLT